MSKKVWELKKQGQDYEIQWHNGALGAPATPGGDVLGGRQIVIKMWDNFATLTARLAKVRIWFSNLTIYVDFRPYFDKSLSVSSKARGAIGGQLFAAEGRHFG